MGGFEKWRRSLAGGQEEALLRMLHRAAGGDKGADVGTRKVLTEEWKITLVLNNNRTAFDRLGRRIPFGITGPSKDADRNFVVKRTTKFDEVARIARLGTHFRPGLTFCTAAELKAKTAELVKELSADKQHKNVLRGPWFPICLPQMDITEADYGAMLEDTFLSAVGSSYVAEFPERKFRNHLFGTLADAVSIIPESRHGLLLEMMRAEPVIALYFPTALQGFGLDTDVEQMTTLPESFLLAGGIDTATAMTMYPDFLAQGWYTSGQDCAALRWQSSVVSLYFKAFDGGFSFEDWDLDAYDYYSGGLLFAGQRQL